MSDLFLSGIGHLTTNIGGAVTDAVVVVEDGHITFAGPAGDAPEQGDLPRHECHGAAVIPGFVDAHTHLIFSGDRSDEFARRLAGENYADIAAAGGGILATVTATRSATEKGLFDLAAQRVRTMISGGTTTLEIKSGYGLDLETELRFLRVARRIGEELPVTVRTTFLGAHSVPLEYRSDRDAYIDLVVHEMLPAITDLADFCDVFVEDGVFSVDEARRIFNAANAGLSPTVWTHAVGRRLHCRPGHRLQPWHLIYRDHGVGDLPGCGSDGSDSGRSDLGLNKRWCFVTRTGQSGPDCTGRTSRPGGPERSNSCTHPLSPGHQPGGSNIQGRRKSRWLRRSISKEDLNW